MSSACGNQPQVKGINCTKINTFDWLPHYRNHKHRYLKTIWYKTTFLKRHFEKLHSKLFYSTNHALMKMYSTSTWELLVLVKYSQIRQGIFIIANKGIGQPHFTLYSVLLFHCSIITQIKRENKPNSYANYKGTLMQMSYTGCPRMISTNRWPQSVTYFTVKIKGIRIVVIIVSFGNPSIRIIDHKNQTNQTVKTLNFVRDG